MKRLSQIVALVSDRKSNLTNKLTAAYHAFQKSDSFGGFSRQYTPIKDGAVIPPHEAKHVAATVPTLLKGLRGPISVAIDTVLAQDRGNQKATGTVGVVVPGQTGKTLTLTDLPVPTLLYLEKFADDLLTGLSKIPTLDPNQQWTLDVNAGLFKTQPVRTQRTSKEQEVVVKFAPTEHHPGQAEILSKDVVVAHIDTVTMSGAITAENRDKIIERVTAFRDAIVIAREQANELQVAEAEIGDQIYSFLFE